MMSDTHHELLPKQASRHILTRRILMDAGPALLVAAIAYFICWRFLLALDPFPQYVTDWWFGPAALHAAGHGMGYGDMASTQELQKFLRHEISSIDSEKILAPEHLKPIGGFHALHRYLLYAVSWCWKLGGISWKALIPLHALFCACTITALYGICRLGFGRLLSMACALVFLMYPAHLAGLANTRDYAKAPFLLGAIFLMGLIIRNGGTHPRRLIISSAGLGLLLGIGMGFRADLLIGFYAALALILFGLKGTPWRTWRLRLACAGMLLLFFSIPASPIIYAMFHQQSAQGSHLILGLARGFNAALGISGTPYVLLWDYSDSLMQAAITRYGHEVMGVNDPISYLSSTFGGVSQDMLSCIVKTFPADMLLRAWASVLRLLQDAPLHLGDIKENGPLMGAKAICLPIVSHLAWAGPWYAMVALLIIAARDVRLALAAFAMLCCFTGYPALQFAPRHYFHLTFFSLWCAAFVWHTLLRGIYVAIQHLYKQGIPRHLPAIPWRPWASPEIRRLAVFTPTITVLMLVPLVVSGVWQTRTASKLYDHFQNASLKPVSINTDQPMDDTNWHALKTEGLFLASERSKEDTRHAIWSEYLAIDLESFGPYAEIKPLYEADEAFNNHTRIVRIELGRVTGKLRRFRYFLPVYQSRKPDINGVPMDELVLPWGESRFNGVAYNLANGTRITSIHRVADRLSFPLLLWMAYPLDMEASALPTRRQLSWIPSSDDRQRALASCLPPIVSSSTYQSQGPVPSLFSRIKLIAAEAVGIHASNRYNLLPGGGFESWVDSHQTPAGFNPPNAAYSIVQPERKLRAHGRFSVRQTWKQADATKDVRDLFHAPVTGLEPGCSYRLAVRGLNPSGLKACVAVFQLMLQDDGSQKVVRLTPEGYTLPTSYSSFTNGALSFQVLPCQKQVVFIVTYLPVSESLALPASVIWDDWELYPE